MHVLYTKLNFRNIKLENACSGDKVGVLRRDGTFQRMLWLGFISRKQAKEAAGRSVKLQITRVDGHDLQADEYVQGCLVPGGVYAVVDSEVAIVR